MFGTVLWLFGDVYGLFKGLFGAGFMACLRWFYDLFKGLFGVVLRHV